MFAVLHAGHDELGEFVGCPELDFEHQPPAFLGELGEREEVGDRGVVDEDVDGPEPFDGGGHELAAIVGFGEVAGDRDGVTSGGAYVLDGFLQRAGLSGVGLERAGGCGDPHAFGGQSRGDRCPEAAAGPGDDRDPGSSGLVHCRPPVVQHLIC